MFCTKCGKELKSIAKFCPKCGEQLITSNDVGMENNGEKLLTENNGENLEHNIKGTYGNSIENKIDKEFEMKKRKHILLWLGIISIVLITLAVILSLVIASGSLKSGYEAKLDLGRKYLLELDYEQAALAFEEAINIDPKKKDAYIELAEVYVKQGKVEKAIEILENAKDEIDDSNNEFIEKKIIEIERVTSVDDNALSSDPEKKVDSENQVSPPHNTSNKITEIPDNSITSTPSLTQPPISVIGINAGDIITFGSYEQDNNTSNGKEPIEWIVLSNDGVKMLLLSKYALECKSYNQEHTSITWENCSLRTWLNEDFFKEAFNSQERKMISKSLLSNKDNPIYGTKGGNDTEDNVFLLSWEEVTMYMFDQDYKIADSKRRCAPTSYVAAQGVFTSEFYGNEMDEFYMTEEGEFACYWWLRSPGGKDNFACCVTDYGCVETDDGGRVSYGIDNDNGLNICVRPALYIYMDYYQSLTPTPEPIMKPDIIDTELKNSQQGDVVVFGSYEQDNNIDNGKEEIEWIVLSNDGADLFLVSKYGLDCQPYNINQGETTWENSTIREWLNNEFFNSAFSSEERNMIKTSKLNNSENAELGIKSGNDTEDKIFLLSVEDVIGEEYGFIGHCEVGDVLRRCAPTNYAADKGVCPESEYKTVSGDSACIWWLRSCLNSDEAAYVVYSGYVNLYGYEYNSKNLAVRPALHIKVGSTTTKTIELTEVEFDGTSGIKRGDTIIFGTYEQDNNKKNGKEPIEWIVLDIKQDSILVLSKYAIDCKQYNDTLSNVTWKNCSLRKWLNEDFFKSAFSKSERKKVKEVLLKNTDSNGNYVEDTKDKVFLLSIYDILKSRYGFDTNPDADDLLRRCSVTTYAKAQGAFTLDDKSDEWDIFASPEGKPTCWWWLRSAGYSEDHVIFVSYSGIVSLSGCYVDDHAIDNRYFHTVGTAIRPALYIKLE